MPKSTIVKCPSCQEQTDVDYMVTYNEKYMCEGCAQWASDCSEYSDPLGMGWTNNVDYNGDM